MRVLPAPNELIVVAEVPIPGLVDDVLRAGARVLEGLERGEREAALGLGARAARCEYVLFVDADVVAPADIVARVRDVMHAPAPDAAGTGSTAAPAKRFAARYSAMLEQFVRQQSPLVSRRDEPWTWLLAREASFTGDLELRFTSRLAGALAAALLVAGCAAFIDPRALWVAGGAGASLAAIDRPLWRFFRDGGGAAFATAALLWHWTSYLTSALAITGAVATPAVVGRRRASSN